MSSAKDDSIYLEHMLECITKIEQYTHNRLETLQESSEIWDATLRRLQIMSESSTHLSEALKQSSSEIEWHKIRGFRNILV
jgi:uncharacterized protein with HEPN domain